MFDDLKAHVKDWENIDELSEYLQSLLDKKGFDKSGLIYGMGHAVYSESDPRAVILKHYAEKLSEEKGMQDEYALYARVESIAGELIMKHRRTFKTVSANVDFYSGFVYTMLKLPIEMFTPIFAISRISGWSAHRIEELVNNGKIIRPAYKFVGTHKSYIPIDQRDWDEME
jgi:citrate synthase